MQRCESQCLPCCRPLISLRSCKRTLRHSPSRERASALAPQPPLPLMDRKAASTSVEGLAAWTFCSVSI
jgi:hypothetical protein